MSLNGLFSSRIGGGGIIRDVRFFLGTSGTSLSVEEIPVTALDGEELMAAPDGLPI